jgi:signal transduction histidine kinase
MATIATGVLHNVGNILNSINISAEISLNTVVSSRLTSFIKADEMLEENLHQIENFLCNDEQGKKLVQLFLKLKVPLLSEQEILKEEIKKIQACASTIQGVIQTQQKYASPNHFLEEIDVNSVVEDSLLLQINLLAKHNVDIIREYSDNIPIVQMQKSKLVHVITNLIQNGRDAVSLKPVFERKIIIRTQIQDQVSISIEDNGVGISSENKDKIFTHGFTTKKNGHGFGLHTSANYMNEMGKSLAAKSEGVGKGATFIITLPLTKK